LKRVKAPQLATMRFLALLFLLPGLAGMILSATISSHYAHTLPTWPHPADQRMIPRNIHSVIVYQTVEEDRRLDLMEYTSVVVFLIGLGMGCVYLNRWGIAEAIGAMEDDLTPEEISRYG
jgi:predicted Na+-dependent transporter